MHAPAYIKAPFEYARTAMAMGNYACGTAVADTGEEEEGGLQWFN